MAAARPFLAPVEKRLLAFAVDSALLLLAILMIYGVLDALGQGPMLLIGALPIVYFGYHVGALLDQRFAFGRVVAAISVVSIRGNALTHTQAFVRSAVRAILVALGFAGAVLSHEPWIIAVPCILEVALIAVNPWSQSIADVLAGTLVVRTPEVQPHRAPAAPMFSCTDAEFGNPPKWRD